MVEMGSENVSGIEVLHAFPSGSRMRPLPTIFFFHGYTSSKEVYAYFAYALAKAGFRVIAPDALMHGARFDGDEARRWRCFWDIFLNNVSELPLHLDWCREQGLIDGDRVGICGASMGGMTALAAMTQYPWLRAVACFMGSGYFSSLSQTLFPPVAPEEPGAQAQLQALADRVAPFDVRHQLDKVSDRPLLLWHGLADELVPAQESERLYRELTARQSHQHLTYLTEAGIGHKITPTALQAGADFFSRSL